MGKTMKGMLLLLSIALALSLVPAAWAAGGEGDAAGSPGAAEPAFAPALSLGAGEEAMEEAADGSLEPAVPSVGATHITWKRISDKTAFGTMRKIVAEGWGSNSGGTVVVATSANFPDALAASGVAGLSGAPVLVTEPKALSAEARAELQRIRPVRVVVAGGKYAVSEGVLSAIRSALPKARVARLKGATASGTAAALNRDAYGARKAATAILATSLAFQDALSAAPVAYAKKYPVFLVDGMDSVSAETVSAMKACGVKKVIVVGGKYAVSDKVVDRLAANGISLQARLKGATAYDTSNAIANYAVRSLGMKAARTGAATGKSYTDALCGAALCGKRNSPLVLVDVGQLASVSGFVRSYASSISPGYVFGGKYAVSDFVYGCLEDPFNLTVLNTLLISNNTNLSTKTVTGYDITGDGVADTIKFEVVAKDSSWASLLKIYVNGKLCRTMGSSGAYAFYRRNVSVKYMRLSNGTPFLLVKCNANNGDGYHQVLQFTNGSLACVANATDLPSGFGNHLHINDAKATGDTIKVTYQYMTRTAGAVLMGYDFKLSGSILKRTSNVTSDVSYYMQGKSGSGKYYGKARTSFRVFTDVGLGTGKYTVRSGEKICLNRACIQSGNLYFEAKTSAGNTGWFKALTQGLGAYGSQTLIDGTYLAG